MFKNFVVFSVRNLYKSRIFTLINITGLALGIACFLLIISYVLFEYSYDNFQTDLQRIYRVESLFFKGDNITDNWPSSTNGYAPAMHMNFPEIQDFTRINWHDSYRTIRYDNNKFREKHVCFADSNFFTFFSYPVIKGNPQTCLIEPNSIVISKSIARKIFNEKDPMNKILIISTLRYTYHCIVTGVFEDVPDNSSLRFDALISWETSPLWMRDFWYLHESYTYVKIDVPAQVVAVEEKFPELAEQYKTNDALKDLKWAVDLVPMKDIHLTSAKPYEIDTKGNRKAVNFFSIVAIIILVIAWINYINLTTARAIDRAKEVGIRKVSGSSKFQLLSQCMLDAFIVNIFALITALIFVFIGKTLISKIVGDIFNFDFWFTETFLYSVLCVFIMGVFGAGTYPAIVISGFKPIRVLKGRFIHSRGGNLYRKILSVVQFGASFILIAGTIIVYKQIQFMRDKDPGINIEKLLVLEAPVQTDDYEQKIETFKKELRRIPGVEKVTGSGTVAGMQVAKFLANRPYHANASEDRLYEMLMTDYDFIDTYGLEIISGRNFDRDRPSDLKGLILNESSVRQFGFADAESAINEKIHLEINRNEPNEVIGVIKDYHQQSLQNSFTPIIIFMDPEYSWIPIEYYSIRFNTRNKDQIMNESRRIWDSFFPESSFDYFFLDEFYNQQYKMDVQYGKIFTIFSIIAIFIAVLGLLGLSIYSTSQRTKEIGIRKVLGASESSIYQMLAKEIVLLITVATLIAIPATYFAMAKWLNSYAFKINPPLWAFFVPILVLLIISLTTISKILLDATRTNPVNTLRYE
jgi:putative ABC transport system permease protein